MLETLDYTIHIGSTPSFLYLDLYLYSAYTAHYIYCSTQLVSPMLAAVDFSFPSGDKHFIYIFLMLHSICPF